MERFNDHRKVKLEHIENLVAIAIVDGSIEEEEKRFLADKASEFGLTTQDVNAVLKEAEQSQIRIAKNNVDKEDQLADAVYMALINGQVTEEEYQLCLQLAEKLELEKSDVDKIIELITRLCKNISGDFTT